MQVWNPSFDVTPAGLIAGIVTEKGLIPKSRDGAFEVAKLLASSLVGNGAVHPVNGTGSHIPGFYALDLESVKEYLAASPKLCKLLGPSDSKSQWKVDSLSCMNP